MRVHGKHLSVIEGIWPPILLVMVGIPLALELVAPNSFYGVRTSETLGSSEVWYRANFYAGFVGVLSGIAAAFANLAIIRSSQIPERKKWWFTIGTTLLAAGAMIVAGLLTS